MLELCGYILHEKFVLRLGCINTDMPGDGYCDDTTNNMECYYDGGDCCGEIIQTDFCNECLCINEDIQASPYTT